MEEVDSDNEILSELCKQNIDKPNKIYGITHLKETQMQINYCDYTDSKLTNHVKNRLHESAIKQDKIRYGITQAPRKGQKRSGNCRPMLGPTHYGRHQQANG